MFRYNAFYITDSREPAKRIYIPLCSDITKNCPAQIRANHKFISLYVQI